MKHLTFLKHPAGIGMIAALLLILLTMTAEALPGRPPRKKAIVRRPQPAKVLVQAAHSAHRPMRIVTEPAYTIVECNVRDIHFAVVDTGITIHQFTAQRSDALVAMNGGFFDWFNGRMAPTGLVVSDDVLFAPAACRVCAKDDGRGRGGKLARKACHEQVWYDIFAVDQFNRISVIHAADYDNHFGMTTSELRLALEAGPTLVDNGIARDRSQLPGRFSRRRYCRSAFGVSHDGRILLLTTRRGYPLHEVADILVDHGAVWAMNLDGDSSANMVVPGNDQASIVCGPRTRLNTIVYVTH